MLIQLPNETWIEILNWLKRRDLLNKLDALWDRQFTPIIQDWLHKYTRNVRIGHLWADGDVLKVPDLSAPSTANYTWKQVPIAEVELPENITGFRRINISGELGPATLAFLHRMRPLYRNVCLELQGFFRGEMPTQHQTNIRLLMPLISTDQQIESFILYNRCLHFLADNFHPSIRFNARLLCFLDYNPDDSELLIDWLFTPRQDGQARTLVFYDSFGNLCTEIKERFMGPARQLASPFFARWYGYGEPSVTENARTGERLTVREVGRGRWLMTNCPLGADGDELLARKTAEALDWDDDNQQRKISVFYYGSFGDVEGEQQQQLADDDNNNIMDG